MNCTNDANKQATECSQTNNQKRHLFSLPIILAVTLLAGCAVVVPDTSATEPPASLADDPHESTQQQDCMDYLAEKYPDTVFHIHPDRTDTVLEDAGIICFDDSSVPGRTFELYRETSADGRFAYLDNYYAVRAEQTISQHLEEKLVDAGLCPRGVHAVCRQPVGEDITGTESAEKLAAVSRELDLTIDVFLDLTDNYIGNKGELEYAQSVLQDTGLCGDFHLYLCGSESASLRDADACETFLAENGDEAFQRALDFRVGD